MKKKPQANMPASNSKCVVLVPALSQPTAKCEAGLKELVKKGYTVKRVRGFSAVDQGRNTMASDALHDRFDEMMWIDTDIGFEAADVDKLRAHRLPLVAGLYPQPGGRSLACELLDETREVVFGEEGGLLEVKYVAAGFMLVRRKVFETVRDKLQLPLCNTRFGSKGVWPFFLPLTIEDESAGATTNGNSGASQVRHRYLTDDFAFCHRVRQAGFKVMVDTSIRLWRTGSYGYGWEEAGQDVERFDTYRFEVSGE
jgi:hypothetical protein